MIELFSNHEPVLFNCWRFPGKEVGISIPYVDPTKPYLIQATLVESSDLVVILNMADALARAGVPKEMVLLSMPYLPYARQDRVCAPGESFALETFIRALSTGHIGTISVADVHSDVGLQLLNEHFPMVLHQPQWLCAAALPKFDCLIAPDKGASEKILQHEQVVSSGTPVVILSKTRKDGQVIYDPLDIGVLQGDVCVVDDIADGCATFVSLGKMILGTQPEVTSLSLYVTHGLFSKGVGVLEGIYDKVYVHNLMNENATGVIEI